MDSGNSGSLQSSSGRSEEYYSRVESISAFFNHNQLSHVGRDPLGNQPPPPPVLQKSQSHSSSTMFDPLSYLDHHPLSRSLQLPTTTANPSSVLNLDATWSKNLRSELNCTDLSGFMSVSSAAPTTQHLFTNQQAQSRATFPLLQVPQGPESSNQSSVSATNSKLNKINSVRNSKKRPRASRRAPTTVLTTDTTNFRAMVQEFTGIPTPPLTSSLFPRTRLDLFGPPSSTLRPTHLDLSPAPHYLLRPFSRKISPPPFLSSSMADAIDSNPSTNNNSSSRSNTSSSSTSINYQRQLPSELGHLKLPQNILNINMQNPILNLQSLLQPAPKYPLSGSEEFGLSQGHVNTSLIGLQNMVSSQEHDMNGGCYRNVSNLSSSSPSDFHSDKVPEHVASRSEGMVESWICSSD